MLALAAPKVHFSLMKQTPTPKERMRLNLELADNGIILRRSTSGRLLP